MVKREEKLIAQHKRARYDYEILETLEAGIVLLGSEVKSMRIGKASINEAYAGEMADDPTAIYLFNANITEYAFANRFGHEAKRPRKLLLRSREVKKLIGNVRKKAIPSCPFGCILTNGAKPSFKSASPVVKTLLISVKPLKNVIGTGTKPGF